MTDFNQKTHDTDVGSHGGQSRQMMKVFENQEFGSIRVLQEAGKTFFCASDVAKALGYHLCHRVWPNGGNLPHGESCADSVRNLWKP